MIRRRSKPVPRSNERGVTMILVALAMLSMLAIVALAIDVMTLYSARTETQRVADAAALAAAKVLVDSGVTGDPSNGAVQTAAQALATQAAKDVGKQLVIAGRQVQGADVTVNFPNTGAASFGVNPQVSVTVQNAFLPAFFSRIWSSNSLTVQATAVAEALNPSNASGLAGGNSMLVVPRCVKPFITPNCDPVNTNNPGSPCGGGVPTFINPATGVTTNNGQTPAGIIGESFTLRSACTNPPGPGTCTLPPSSVAGQYYPADIPAPSVGADACPSCAALSTNFQTNIECCNPTPLACGTTLNIDTSQIPDKGFGPASSGVQCLIHQQPGNGQDLLNDGLNLGPPPVSTPVAYPLAIQAGDNHPLKGGGVTPGDYISASDSIVTLPIYDGTPVTAASTVTIIGYLQVFINQSNPDGSFDVTILNVAGCGTGASGTAIAGGGTSPIPVRLIHQ